MIKKKDYSFKKSVDVAMVSLYDEYQSMPALNTEILDRDIINLHKLDFSSQEGLFTIRKVAISNNVMVAAIVSKCAIIRSTLNTSGSDEEIEISKRQEDIIKQIFIDPTGHHTIVSLSNGDNYYLHSRSTRPKKFSKLSGCLECIAFDRRQTTESSTKNFLACTSTGCIYEICLDSSGKEKNCQLVFQLEDAIAITSIHFDSINSNNDGIFVMLATTQPTRLYQLKKILKMVD